MSKDTGNLTVTIKQGGVVKKVFTNQSDDFCALRFLLNNQPQSTDYAMRYGGWAVNIKDEQTGEEYDWKPYSRRTS
jgi:hypothetical protein